MSLVSKLEQTLRLSVPDLDDSLAEYLANCLSDDPNALPELVGPFLGEFLSQLQIDALTTSLRDLITEAKKDGGDGEIRLLARPERIEDTIDQLEENVAFEDRMRAYDNKKLDKINKKRAQKLNERDFEEITKQSQSSRFTETPTVVQQDHVPMAGNDIVIQNFDLYYGSKTLLLSTSLLLSRGKRYGLVGRNGVGKTTLMKSIAKRELNFAANISMLHVEQEAAATEVSVIDYVLEADRERTELLREERRLKAQLEQNPVPAKEAEIIQKLSAAAGELEMIGAYTAPARAASILSGLGFGHADQRRATREFSGGWRMRISLASALFVKPLLLLLDEPTNMLDLRAVIWLEEYLRAWPHTLLVISHDRSFLNHVASDIYLMHDLRLRHYRGNYDTFWASREGELANQQREFESQQALRKATQEFIDKFRYNAKRASLVQSKIKMLQKTVFTPAVVREPPPVFRFPVIPPSAETVVHFGGVSFSYPGRPVFEDICLTISMTSRVCIVGDNGSGKSTLLKLIIGQLQPTGGSLVVSGGLRVGYFSQHHVDQLDYNLTPVEVMHARMPGQTVEFYRTKLGCFGISGQLGMRPVRTLSGGQKSRVAFALLCLTNPNFIVLDEPTNHLDVESVEALGKAIMGYKGGVVLVSHEGHLLDMVCTDLWHVCNGRITVIPEGFEEYRSKLEREIGGAA